MAMIQAKFVHLLFLIQERSNAIEMADKLRENGKIYAVVAVVFLLFLGLLIYLILLDRKISKIEQRKTNE